MGVALTDGFGLHPYFRVRAESPRRASGRTGSGAAGREGVAVQVDRAQVVVEYHPFFHGHLATVYVGVHGTLLCCLQFINVAYSASLVKHFFVFCNMI